MAEWKSKLRAALDYSFYARLHAVRSPAVHKPRYQPVDCKQGVKGAGLNESALPTVHESYVPIV